jgi:hypothetical protein
MALMANQKKRLPIFALSWLMALLVVGSMPLALAAPTEPIQTQDANVSGIVAEIMECKRKDGVLTIKMRLRNISDKDIRVDVIRGRNYDQYYVTAASKKYFVLTDTEKVPLASAADSGGSIYANIPKPAVGPGGLSTLPHP